MRATGTRRPLCEPPVYSSLPLRQRAIRRGGVVKGGSGSSPRWNEIIDLSPPPVLQGVDYIITILTGGGRGWACIQPNPQAGETRGRAPQNLPTSGKALALVRKKLVASLSVVSAFISEQRRRSVTFCGKERCCSPVGSVQHRPNRQVRPGRTPKPHFA